MNKLPRVDKNALFTLINELMSCGFRGSAQSVVDKNIEEYITAQHYGKTRRLKCSRCSCSFAKNINNMYYCYNCNAEMIER